MTAPTSPPTLEALGDHWRVFRKHYPVGAYLPVGQLDGDCRECGGSWPCQPIADAIRAWLAGQREAVAEALFAWNTPTDPYFVINGGRSREADSDGPYEPIADAVLRVLTEAGDSARRGAGDVERLDDAMRRELDRGGWR